MPLGRLRPSAHHLDGLQKEIGKVETVFSAVKGDPTRSAIGSRRGARRRQNPHSLSTGSLPDSPKAHV